MSWRKYSPAQKTAAQKFRHFQQTEVCNGAETSEGKEKSGRQEIARQEIGKQEISGPGTQKPWRERRPDNAQDCARHTA
jgi:hypothetical protein